MKNRLFIAVILLLFAGFSVRAQSISIDGGLTLSSVDFGDHDPYAEDATIVERKLGFDAGLTYHGPINDRLTFDIGVFYSQSGFRAVEEYDESIQFQGNTLRVVHDAESKLTFNYLRVPMTVSYFEPMATGEAFFKLGPVIGYGTSAHYDYDMVHSSYRNGELINEYRSTDTDSESFTDAELEEFDLALMAGAGVQVHNVRLQAEYMHSFTDTDPDDHWTLKHRSINLKVGYLFNLR